MKSDDLRLRVRRLIHGQRKMAIVQIAVASLLIVAIGFYATKPIQYLAETFGIDNTALIASVAFGAGLGFFIGIMLWQIFISCMILLRKGLIFRALQAYAAEDNTDAK